MLRVRGLRTELRTPRGDLVPVNRVDVELGQGRSLGVVGESGCGKSMLALSLMGLIPDPPARITAGEILFKGRDLRGLSNKEFRKIRGRDMAMIFQEPMTALNPVLSVGKQVREALGPEPGNRLHVDDQVQTLLGRVGLPEPKRLMRAYPHELSGGMRQRVVIAMALARGPDLVLADEPTTALDATVQSRIIDLLGDLQREQGAALLLISHDLGVVARACERVAVMYAGSMVEKAGARDLFAQPLHPYTRGLMDSLPSLSRGGETSLSVIPGQVPDLAAMPRGCPFHPRCAEAMQRCRTEFPPMLGKGQDREVRCWLYERA